MNQGSNPPSGQPGGKGRRRRRGRRGPAVQGAASQHQPGQSQGQGQQRHHGGPAKSRPHGRKPGQQRGPRGQNQLGGGIYTAPMDHSYRALQGKSNGNQRRPGRGGPSRQFVPADLDPLPPISDSTPARIFAFVDELFFVAKIQETARKMNVKVEFVKTDKELYEKMGQNGVDKPSLIIFDLNNANAKPLTAIPKLKAKLKKGTNIIGFVSHVQGDLKVKAQEAGCDMVVPRSAFSQNLPSILRRHGAADEGQDEGQQPQQPMM